MLKGRTWRGATPDQLDAIRSMLLTRGAQADKELKNPHELWRVRIENTVFTAYRTGSINCNGGEIHELGFLYAEISKSLGQSLEKPTASFLVGLDETGKGEVLGHAALAAVKVASELLPKLDLIVSTIDTKTRKQFSFWDAVMRELDAFRGNGLEYEVETIPPWDVDRYNTNKILDVVYQRLLGRILRGEDTSSLRVVVDDYGLGRNLSDYLDSLHTGGSEIRVEARADEHYAEVRAASIVSKWRRELAMKRVNERFSLKDTPVGSGNAGDPVTVKWLGEWKATGQPWPWFVKTSYVTIRKLDGRLTKTPKVSPPIRHELLSPESARRFREGQLSSSSLTVVCPACGALSAACKLTPDLEGGLVGRCVGCNEVISDLDTTLRYYCGSVMPDSDVIIAGLLSKDLDKKGFLGGFTFLIHPIVRKETDTPGGKTELARLGDFAAMGRISMEQVTGPSPDESASHDAAIISGAKFADSILLTRDKGMYGNAVASKVFCLTFRT